VLEKATAHGRFPNNIRHTTKLDIERKRIKTRDISSQPFDISFDPDQPTIDEIHIHCPFSTIGADITIGHSAITPSSFNFSPMHISKSLKRESLIVLTKKT
jgi:hypothetical protein